MQAEWSRGELWRRKLLYPGHTLPTAIAPAAVAAGLAWHDGAFALLPAAAALFAGWLIQLGGVLTDNYQNLLQEPEDREHPELVRALKSGTLTLGQLRLAMLACLVFALLAGLYLTLKAGPGVIAIGFASIAAAYAYSAGPFAFGRHGLADPLFFLFFGVVSVAGVYYVQAEHLPWAALALGVPVGALTTNILVIDDIRDREFDVRKGKNTIAVRFGAKWSRAEFAALLAIAYLCPFWFWLGYGFDAWVLLPLLTLPYAIDTLLDVMKLDKHADLIPITPKAGRVLLGFSILLAAGVALARG
ncbi:MAG TPA: 1,4-dihydroxy-2-naphthoate octaprenyltransferase [Steroidobacteraceae bacterium]|nr:1,4-dihydroxy-2-naphthoate octaprenyltransferase [Steroidobacteraceae bacterium]